MISGRCLDLTVVLQHFEQLASFQLATEVFSRPFVGGDLRAKWELGRGPGFDERCHGLV